MELQPRTIRVPGLAPGGPLEFEVLADDTIIGPAIENGGWEEHETALYRAHLEPGALVVDLGANVGWYSVRAILAGCEVHAFEPVPGIADMTVRYCTLSLPTPNAVTPRTGVWFGMFA